MYRIATGVNEMATSPLMRVPAEIKPYVMKLVQLYKFKLADDAIRAIDAAQDFDDAIAPLRPAEKKKIAS